MAIQIQKTPPPVFSRASALPAKKSELGDLDSLLVTTLDRLCESDPARNPYHEIARQDFIDRAEQEGASREHRDELRRMAAFVFDQETASNRAQTFLDQLRGPAFKRAAAGLKGLTQAFPASGEAKVAELALAMSEEDVRQYTKDAIISQAISICAKGVCHPALSALELAAVGRPEEREALIRAGFSYLHRSKVLQHPEVALTAEKGDAGAKEHILRQEATGKVESRYQRCSALFKSTGGEEKGPVGREMLQRLKEESQWLGYDLADRMIGSWFRLMGKDVQSGVAEAFLTGGDEPTTLNEAANRAAKAVSIVREADEDPNMGRWAWSGSAGEHGSVVVGNRAMDFFRENGSNSDRQVLKLIDTALEVAGERRRLNNNSTEKSAIQEVALPHLGKGPVTAARVAKLTHDIVKAVKDVPFTAAADMADRILGVAVTLDIPNEDRAPLRAIRHVLNGSSKEECHRPDNIVVGQMLAKLGEVEFGQDPVVEIARVAGPEVLHALEASANSSPGSDLAAFVDQLAKKALPQGRPSRSEFEQRARYQFDRGYALAQGTVTALALESRDPELRNLASAVLLVENGGVEGLTDKEIRAVLGL